MNLTQSILCSRTLSELDGLLAYWRAQYRPGLNATRSRVVAQTVARLEDARARVAAREGR